LEGHYLAKTLAVEVEHNIDPECRHFKFIQWRDKYVHSIIACIWGQQL
jgi:hypothetical protein